MLKPLQYKLHDAEETYASGALLRPYPITLYDTTPTGDDVTPKQPDTSKTIGVLLVRVRMLKQSTVPRYASGALIDELSSNTKCILLLHLHAVTVC